MDDDRDIMPHGKFELCREEWDRCIKDSIPCDAVFTDNCRYLEGRIHKELLDKIKDSIYSCNYIEYKMKDVVDGFVYSATSDKRVELLNHNFLFFDIKDPQLQIIKDICKSLESAITDYFKSGFRIMNIRAVRSVTNANKNFGSNKRHTDGNFPLGTHKILLYLTEVGGKHGSTNLILSGRNKRDESFCLKGDPGTYILFNPCIIRHNGIPPSIGYKDIIEITLCPWHETIIEPVFGGTNARHEIRP